MRCHLKYKETEGLEACETDPFSLSSETKDARSAEGLSDKPPSYSNKGNDVLVD